MKSWIAGALMTCLAVVVVAGVVTRHASHKQDAVWCHQHGYPNYATKDRFCIGAGGKLVKVGTGKKFTEVGVNNKTFSF